MDVPLGRLEQYLRHIDPVPALQNFYTNAIPAAILIACIYIPLNLAFPRPPPDWNGATGAAGSAPCPRLPTGSSWPSGHDGTG